jgi:hypothetical protein
MGPRDFSGPKGNSMVMTLNGGIRSLDRYDLELFHGERKPVHTTGELRLFVLDSVLRDSHSSNDDSGRLSTD